MKIHFQLSSFHQQPILPSIATVALATFNTNPSTPFSLYLDLTLQVLTSPQLLHEIHLKSGGWNLFFSFQSDTSKVVIYLLFLTVIPTFQNLLPPFLPSFLPSIVSAFHFLPSNCTVFLPNFLASSLQHILPVTMVWNSSQAKTAFNHVLDNVLKCGDNSPLKSSLLFDGYQ